MGNFIPGTKKEQQAMLQDIGFRDWEDLFRDIPEDTRFRGELDMPPGRSDLEVEREIRRMAGKNRIFPHPALRGWRNLFSSVSRTVRMRWRILRSAAPRGNRACSFVMIFSAAWFPWKPKIASGGKKPGGCALIFPVRRRRFIAFFADWSSD